MMPGIAIQPGFPIAAAPAARSGSAMADDHFAQTLHGKPKAGTQADRPAGRADKSDPQDAGGVDEKTSPHGGKEDKVDRSTAGDDGRDAVDDEDTKKDEDDRGGGALPLHMKAERVLAQQWPAADPAAAAGNGPVAAGATALQEANPGLSAGSAVTSVQAALPAADADATPQVAAAAKAEPIAGGMAAQLVAAPKQMTKAQTGIAAVAAADAADPMPVVVSVDATTNGSGNATAAFMAKVAALRHGAGSAPSPQGTSGAASSPAPIAEGEVEGKIPQAFASQGFGNADANTDSQGDGKGGAQNKPTPGAIQAPTAAKADAGASPLPTAQMVPASGSAASFAAALANGGRLARYSASAAAAGAPASALPVQSLRIQLRPVELGTVTANLKYSGSQLTIDIEVQTPDAQRRLSTDSSDIVKSLQSLGFQVDKVTVRQVQPQTQTQAQSQSQPQGQATARDGSAGGFSGQGGSPFSMPGQSERQAGHHRQGSEGGNEDASERGIGAVQQAADRHQPRRGVFI